jgi:hypothetical protein
MNVTYKHTQIGTMVLVGAALIVPMVIFLVFNGFILIAGCTALLLILMTILFGSLTVEVAENKIYCWFGPGLIRKQFDLAEITAVETTRYPWYYGWGIRLTPKGWMFNVSGLDAVEITLRSGKHFLIGTDQPHKLASAISQAAGLL